MVTGEIVHRPENGIAPYIVVVSLENGGRLSFAYMTKEMAATMLPKQITAWTALSEGRRVS